MSQEQIKKEVKNIYQVNCFDDFCFECDIPYHTILNNHYTMKSLMVMINGSKSLQFIDVPQTHHQFTQGHQI